MWLQLSGWEKSELVPSCLPMLARLAGLDLLGLVSSWLLLGLAVCAASGDRRPASNETPNTAAVPPFHRSTGTASVQAQAQAQGSTITATGVEY